MRFNPWTSAYRSKFVRCDDHRIIFLHLFWSTARSAFSSQLTTYSLPDKLSPSKSHANFVRNCGIWCYEDYNLLVKLCFLVIFFSWVCVVLDTGEKMYVCFLCWWTVFVPLTVMKLPKKVLFWVAKLLESIERASFSGSFFVKRWLIVAVGCWLLAFGYWLLAIGYWLLAFGFNFGFESSRGQSVRG